MSTARIAIDLAPARMEFFKMNTPRKLFGLGCAIALLAVALPAAAQAKYPDRPVKVVVALPAGGGVDMMARLVGQRLAAEVGQPFVVDNRAGASGRIGLPLVTKAAQTATR